MGINNRQRRAAQQRKRARGRPGRPDGRVGPTPGDASESAASYDVVGEAVASTMHWIVVHQPDERHLIARAEALLDSIAPTPDGVVQSVVGDLAARTLAGVVDGGWDPSDLTQLVVRSGGPRHLPTLLTVLYDESRGNSARGMTWVAALESLGADPRVRFTSTPELASALLVTALLTTAPLVDIDTLAPAGGSAPHPKLAQVRALLAKAESTTFDEEAEALSAKAQELISRYALGRLLDGAAERQGGATDGIAVRRIWLDAPYVRAKATLVHEVAAANNARAAVSERHGFSIVVGAAHDLDATELLVTSLLVQANRAMLRHGRRVRGDGSSQTRSFRHSFLVAYAARIGQRLREVTQALLAEDADRYLPVVRDQAARASATFEAMVPHKTGRGTSVSNGEGYAAGLAAADVAKLDVNGQIGEAG